MYNLEGKERRTFWREDLTPPIIMNMFLEVHYYIKFFVLLLSKMNSITLLATQNAKIYQKHGTITVIYT